jgi:hypothetical protein
VTDPIDDLFKGMRDGSTWCSETGHGDGGLRSTRKDGKPKKRNTYAQACWFCGRLLQPGEGCVELSKKDSAWHVYCLAGLSQRPPDQRVPTKSGSP